MTGSDAITDWPDREESDVKPIRRGDTFHLRRRVPKRYARVEPRAMVWLTLKTDSERDAIAKANAAWDQMIGAWEAKLAGDVDDAEARLKAAKELAHRRGFRFLTADRVLALPLTEILDRIDAIRDGRDGLMDRMETDALLGTVSRPEITMSSALDIYFEITGDKVRKKSPDQLRRWQNPLKRAVRNWISVVGDTPLEKISIDDVYDFRDWWDGRVESEALTPSTANKDFVYLSVIFKAINKRKRLRLAVPFDGVRLENEERRHRSPFSETFLRETFLRPGAFDGLNTEARCIVLGMVNTGYRPSEGASLTRDQIRLDTDVPHISIEPVGRQLKSQYSRRVIPLAGISLEAFRQCPDGFPRYADSPTLSNLVNRYLRANGLVETPKHTLYGLRHSFEDRLLDRDIDERIRRDLMGHTLNRERYGKGASIEKLAEIIHLIAL